MKVAVIGAGFGGLAAGLKLAESGIDTVIFERDNFPGGLASGFKQDKWNWSLENHYHHYFVSDTNARNLAEKYGQRIIYSTPITSTFVGGGLYQLDNPLSLLRFPLIPFTDRLRTGLGVMFMKLWPFWGVLEGIDAEPYVRKIFGEKSWSVLWSGIFEKKFGPYHKEVNAAWFWSRFHKRSRSLGYPEGGFRAFADKLADKFISLNGKIRYGANVTEIKKEKGKFSVTVNSKKQLFDAVVITAPGGFIKSVKGLPTEYFNNLTSLKGLGAINMILSLKKPLFENGEYWVSVTDREFPFIVVVDHTNFMDSHNYDGEHIVYVGNYLETNHKFFTLTPDELLNVFAPYLSKMNPGFIRKWINWFKVEKSNFAQVVVEKNYSMKIPAMETPIKGLYLATVQQAPIGDGGTNYAIELGQLAAQKIIENG